MKFIQFVIVYLLLFVSYLSYRFAQLEPNHLHAMAETYGALAGVLIVVVKLILAGINKDSVTDSDD